MSSEPLKHRDQELSNGIRPAYIEQYRSVIYRWKGFREHFSLKICKFAYLSNTFCGRACIHHVTASTNLQHAARKVIVRKNIRRNIIVDGGPGVLPRRKFYKLVSKRCLLSKKKVQPPLLDYEKKTSTPPLFMKKKLQPPTLISQPPPPSR